MTNIQMHGFADSVKILDQKTVSMTDLSKVYKHVKGKIDGVTWESVRTKASRPLLKELLKGKILKSNQKVIKKKEKKRKLSEDEIDAEIDSEMKQIGEIKKKIKKP